LGWNGKKEGKKMKNEKKECGLHVVEHVVVLVQWKEICCCERLRCGGVVGLID